uniref:Solute carrier family 35 member F1 n=1 Tax=Heterorhabditis bacteriophora TaxID=37862 RepID=A0A1I7WNN7_HETBA
MGILAQQSLSPFYVCVSCGHFICDHTVLRHLFSILQIVDSEASMSPVLRISLTPILARSSTTLLCTIFFLVTKEILNSYSGALDDIGTPLHRATGVCICLIGIACLIWADIEDGKGSIGGNHRVLGDLLCIGGALLYAVANVSEEFLVKQHSRMEYLGMVGLFGSLISGVQLAVLEHKNLAQIDWNLSTISFFLLFAISMFIFYSLVTIVLQKTSALMFNLSTLTADFYSLMFGLFLFKDTVSPLPANANANSTIAMYMCQSDTRNCPVHGRRANSIMSTNAEIHRGANFETRY